MHGQDSVRHSDLLFCWHFSGNAQHFRVQSAVWQQVLLTVIIWDYIPLVNGQTLYAATNLYSLVVGFGLALIVNVIVSLLSKTPSKEIMDEFDSIKNIEV